MEGTWRAENRHGQLGPCVACVLRFACCARPPRMRVCFYSSRIHGLLYMPPHFTHEKGRRRKEGRTRFGLLCWRVMYRARLAKIPDVVVNSVYAAYKADISLPMPPTYLAPRNRRQTPDGRKTTFSIYAGSGPGTALISGLNKTSGLAYSSFSGASSTPATLPSILTLRAHGGARAPLLITCKRNTSLRQGGFSSLILPVYISPRAPRLPATRNSPVRISLPPSQFWT